MSPVLNKFRTAPSIPKTKLKCIFMNWISTSSPNNVTTCYLAKKKLLQKLRIEANVLKISLIFFWWDDLKNLTQLYNQVSVIQF